MATWELEAEQNGAVAVFYSNEQSHRRTPAGRVGPGIPEIVIVDMITNVGANYDLIRFPDKSEVWVQWEAVPNPGWDQRPN